MIKQNLIIRLVISIFLLFTTSVSATVILTDEIQKNEHFRIKYFYDESSSLTIQNISKTNFTQTIPSQFTKGYNYGNAWFKFEFQNNSKNNEFVLYFTESIWSTLNLYSKQHSSWLVQKNGLNIPLSEREIKDSSPAFNIHINSGENAVFYVKGNTIASQIGEFQLYTKNEYFNPSRITITEWYIIYAFVLFGFILLNLYNFIVTKERIYAYYIGYVIVYIIFSSMHSGTYISFGFPNWQEGLHVLGQLTLFTLLQFSIEFLELKRTYPLMKKVFNYLSVVSLLFAFLLSQNILYSTIASNIFFSGVLIFIVYVAIKIFRNGFNGAKYYLIALMLYLPSMAMMAMDFNTLLPNTDMTRYSFLGGAFVEIFLFTLILTNRYMDVNKEKIVVQKALIEEQNNNELRLVSEIEKKTNYLTKANIRLREQTTELEKIKEQLTKEATTDMLSGLYNRRYFFEASQKSFYTAMRYEQDLSILMIDIDKFKDLNDTYGHIFGDRVIRVLSNVFKKAIRDSDILARYGGEEFIVLLPQSDKQDSMLLAERIRLEVEREEIVSDNGKTPKITVSIGLTQLDNEEDIDIEQLILRCDKALYNAKDSGRNRVCTL